MTEPAGLERLPHPTGQPELFLAVGPPPASMPFTDSLSLQGRLTGLGGEDLPTIVIVAHYDAFGVAPVRMRALWGGTRASPPPALLQPSSEVERFCAVWLGSQQRHPPSEAQEDPWHGWHRGADTG